MNELLQYITLHEEASVTDLAARFRVSAMTIRRDLAELEQSELISRTHGGAVAPHTLKGEELYESKQQQNFEVKQRIAKKALSMIQEPFGSAAPKNIFLDSGTTCYQVALQLKNLSELRIFTNDLKIASEMCVGGQSEVFITGGRIQPETGSVIGTHSNQFIESLNFALCFIGVSAVSPKFVLSTPSEEKALNKKNIMKHSLKKVLVCDKSKFNQVALFNIASMTGFDCVITDYEFSLSQQKLLKESDTVIFQV
jgi:DeoR/GlpR family transcriptional regulator of sugar metabolism